MSVAVWVGLIALAGLDAETGVVMLLYLTLAYDWRKGAGELRSGADLGDAIVEGAARRIRPKLMPVLTTMTALLPIMWSSGTGADVMRRIAAPIVGGLTTSFLLELTVYPAIFALWKRRGDFGRKTQVCQDPADEGWIFDGVERSHAATAAWTDHAAFARTRDETLEGALAAAEFRKAAAEGSAAKEIP